MAETNRASETVVIFASPRKNGFTAKLLQEFLKQEGIEDYYLFDCYKEMPLPCIACGKCTKVCPQGIDIPAVMKELALRIEEMPKWAEICRQRELERKQNKGI